MPKSTILIVDDDPALIESLSLRYEEAYEILTALNVEEATTKLRSFGHAIDVVILDLTMPLTEVDQTLMIDAGIRVFDAARGNAGGDALAPDCRFIALTATHNFYHPQFQAGGFGVVIKGTPGYLVRLDGLVNEACSKPDHTPTEPVAPVPSHAPSHDTLLQALTEIRNILNKLLPEGTAG